MTLSRAYKEAAIQLAIERGCLIERKDGNIMLNPELEKWIVSSLQDPKLDTPYKVVIYSITGFLGIVDKEEVIRMTGAIIGYLNTLTGFRLEE